MTADPTELPLIICARLNETRAREANQHLPLASAELIADGLRAAEAGAAILHWHARDPAGTGLADDPALYWEVTEAIRARADVLIEPGILFYRLPPADRVRHVTGAPPGLRPDIVPVEMGPFSTDYWDPSSRQFVALGGLYELGNDRISELLGLLGEHRQYVAAACWGPGQVRTARCFQEAGLLGERVLWELVFTGQTFPGGQPPTLPLLQALVALLPREDPWLTYTWNGDGFEMARWSISLGGHVGIGLGDFDDPDRPSVTNAELVRRVAAEAMAAGRSLATALDARRLLGLTAAPLVVPEL